MTLHRPHLPHSSKGRRVLFLAIMGLVLLLLQTLPSLETTDDQKTAVELSGASIGPASKNDLGQLLRLMDDPTPTPGPAATSTITPTLDPTYYSKPLLTAADAISRSLAFAPAGMTATLASATLTRLGVIDFWRGAESPLTDVQAPAWLIAIQASGLTLRDAVEFSLANDATMPIDGIYFVWDAQSGDLLGKGALGSQWRQTMASAHALPTAAITLVPATLIPVPTQTPEPTQTPGVTP